MRSKVDTLRFGSTQPSSGPWGVILAMIAFLNIDRWFNIANITPHGLDDGSVELKRYYVDITFH